MNADLLKLKPCPFCSGGVTRWQSNGIGDKWLECADCGASTRLREDGAGSEKDWNRRATDTQALLDRIRELERDAARYRWLREQHWNEANMAVVCHPKVSVKLGSDCPSGKRLDEAIDAALVGTKKKEESK